MLDDRMNMMMNMKHRPSSVNDNLSEEEAMEIFNELLDIIMSHNISYEMATKIAISFSTAFQMGLVELQKRR